MRDYKERNKKQGIVVNHPHLDAIAERKRQREAIRNAKKNDIKQINYEK
jgi:hypothetical protein